MHCENVTPADAEAALVQLSRHVPVDIEIGRPSVATLQDDDSVAFITSVGLWWSYRGHASRMIEIGEDRLVELTEYAYGLETLRSITRMD